MQERCNSIADALEFCLSCTNPSMWHTTRADCYMHHASQKNVNGYFTTMMGMPLWQGVWWKFDQHLAILCTPSTSQQQEGMVGVNRTAKPVGGYEEETVHSTRQRVDSRFAPSQWEASLHSNAVSHWLGANLESALRQSSDFYCTNLNARTMHLTYTKHFL